MHFFDFAINKNITIQNITVELVYSHKYSVKGVKETHNNKRIVGVALDPKFDYTRHCDTYNTFYESLLLHIPEQYHIYIYIPFYFDPSWG